MVHIRMQVTGTYLFMYTYIYIYILVIHGTYPYASHGYICVYVYIHTNIYKSYMVHIRTGLTYSTYRHHERTLILCHELHIRMPIDLELHVHRDNMKEPSSCVTNYISVCLSTWSFMSKETT